LAGEPAGRFKNRAAAADAFLSGRTGDRGEDAVIGIARRRWIPVVALVVLLAAVLSAATPRSLAVASGQAAASGQRIHLIFKQADITLPLDPSVGTTFVWRGDVLNAAATRIGEAGANCGVVKVGPGVSTAVCDLAFRLPRGQLDFSGMIDFFGNTPDDMFDLAIVGGTGAYRAARGEAHVAVLVSLTYDVIVKLG
jgi:hypothetical protein